MGDLPKGERFQTPVAVYIDFTNIPKNHKEYAPYADNRLTIINGCTSQRSGLGYILLNEKLQESDALGEQLNAFLQYARTGEKPASLMTFRNELLTEKLVDKVIESAKTGRIINFQKSN